MPQLDASQFASQLFWLAVSFAVLYVAASRYILPRLSELMAERSRRIANDLEEAERLDKAAQKAQTQATARLGEARSAAQAAVQKANDEAEAAMRARFEAEVAKLDAAKSNDEAALTEQSKQAREELGEVAKSMSTILVERVVGDRGGGGRGGADGAQQK